MSETFLAEILLRLPGKLCFFAIKNYVFRIKVSQKESIQFWKKLLGIVQEAEMFYFFFESRNDPANDPVVLWMTGTPQDMPMRCHLWTLFSPF